MKRFMTMVEGMLGAGKFQIAGEVDIYNTKAEIDAVLFERGIKMEEIWYPASDHKNPPEWSEKAYHVRSIKDGRRIAGLVFGD